MRSVVKKVEGVSERGLKLARNKKEMRGRGSTIPPRDERGGHRVRNQEMKYLTERRKEKKKVRAQETAKEIPTHVSQRKLQRKL